MASLLEVRGMGKRFLGVAALENVDFDLVKGEVHTLMGENGAGKSTLIKCLTGVYQPESGTTQLSGHEIHPRSPDEAVRLGISTVYQEVNLVPNLSVMENLLLGREPRGPFGIQWRKLQKRAEAAMMRLGVEIDVRVRLGNLSIAHQQMVAIARALDVSAQVLVLDEPTSSLDADEVAALFAIIRKLKSEGIGIIFVSHFLEQVFEISDRVTVLRNGQKVGTWSISELTRLELVSQMIGRDATELDRAATLEVVENSGDPILQAKGISKRGSVSDISLELRAGETLGLAGLLGSGRTEVTRLLYGIDSIDSGSLQIDGSQPSRYRPMTAIQKGIGYLSEDRKGEGIFPELSVRENIVILEQVKCGWLRRMSPSRQKELADDFIVRLKIQPPDSERAIQFLSGGNQQKALLARWLAVEPRLLLLDEPTRGIDVGAKFEIMSLVESMRQSGSSFVFISSELAEVVRSCTKVIVMRDRHSIGTLEGDAITESNIVQEIAGS